MLSNTGYARELGDSFDDILARFEQTSAKVSGLEATSDSIKKDSEKFQADLEQYAKDEAVATGKLPNDGKLTDPKVEVANVKDVLEEDVAVQVKRRGFGSGKAVETEVIREKVTIEEVKSVAPVVTKEVEPKAITQPTNRGFRKRTPLSNLDMSSATRQATYRSSSVITFAEGTSFSGSTEYGELIASDWMAEYCEFNAKDLSTDGVMNNCLDKILELKANPSQSVQEEANKIYNGSFKDTVLASVSKSMDMKNVAANYDEKVLQPLEKQNADVSDLKDAVVALVTTDMENSKLLNNILMIYSSKLGLDSLRDFGNNEIKNNESATVLKKDK